MNANQILEGLIGLREEAIKEAGLVEVTLLSPSEKVLSAIKEAGGTIGAEHWEQWCMSAGQTCACNSHDPGQSSTDVVVPESWLLDRNVYPSRASLVFDFNADDHRDTAVMIVPAVEKVGLVYETKSQHYAGYTSIAYPREVSLTPAVELDKAEAMEAQYLRDMM